MREARLDKWLLTILGLLSAAMIVLQILNSRGTPTPTETALFSVLQFVFALGFAYLLARLSSRKEFQDRQRDFAISAYRRIREIRRLADRLESRTISARAASPGEGRGDIEVLQEMAHGICEAARSSAADWADLIGREIETIEEIENLRARQQHRPNGDESEEPILTERGESTADLVASLPPPLRVEAVEEDLHRQNRMGANIQRLREAIDHDGFLELRAFWEPDGGFEARITDISPSTPMVVGLGDAGSRVGGVLALTADGKSVGVVMNPGMGTYPEFAHALVRALGSSQAPAQLTEVEETEISDRRYFTLRVKPSSEASQS